TIPIDREVLALGKAESPQVIEQRDLMRRVAWSGVEATEAINPAGLLSARRERPRGHRAAEQRDELAPPHLGHRGSLPPWRRRSVYRMLNLPQKGWQVLGADLNPSEIYESASGAPKDSTPAGDCCTAAGLSGLLADSGVFDGFGF